MPVPSDYPKEPGASSCGSTYRQGLFINGELPGTGGYGKQFKYTLPPVVFSDGTTTVPLFWSLANLNDELNTSGGFLDQLRESREARATHYQHFSSKNSESLGWLNLQIDQLLDQARAEAEQISGPGDPGNHRAQATALINEALPFLRCAAYWTWRLILYGQALDAYKRPLGLQLTARPAPPPLRAGPPEAELPPPGPEPEPPVPTAPPTPPAPVPGPPWYRTTPGRVAIALTAVTVVGAGAYGVVSYLRGRR